MRLNLFSLPANDGLHHPACLSASLATRDVGQNVGAGDLLVVDGPVVDVAARPVPAEVAALLQLGRQVAAAIGVANTAVLAAPVFPRVYPLACNFSWLASHNFCPLRKERTWLSGSVAQERWLAGMAGYPTLAAAAGRHVPHLEACLQTSRGCAVRDRQMQGLN
jgi:hypothetical protein